MTPLLNWNDIDLIVFDVDGTLYDQWRLRLAMLRTLRTFRQVREALGDRPEADFMRLQYARTAARHHKTGDEVRALTSECMEHRPLPLLAGCRYPHLGALFAGMRALIRAGSPHPDYGTFRAYDDPVFQPLLAWRAPVVMASRCSSASCVRHRPRRSRR